MQPTDRHGIEISCRLRHRDIISMQRESATLDDDSGFSQWLSDRTMPHDLLRAELNLEGLDRRVSVPFKTESDPIQHQGKRS